MSDALTDELFAILKRTREVEAQYSVSAQEIFCSSMSAEEFEKTRVSTYLARALVDPLRDLLIKEMAIRHCRDELTRPGTTKFSARLAIMSPNDLTTLHRIKNTLVAKNGLSMEALTHG